MPFGSFDHTDWETQREFPTMSNQSCIHIHRHHPPTLLAPPLAPLICLTNPRGKWEARPGRSIHRLFLQLLRLRTCKARETDFPLVEEVADIVVTLHHSTLEANPSVQSITLPFRLAVLKAGRLQQLHASCASQTHRRFRATGAIFEVVVESAPCLFAERWCRPGDGVELVAHEAHVCNGDWG